MTGNEVIWTDEDSIAASREGWDLFDCVGSSNGPFQLCKIDDPQEWQETRGVTIETEWPDDTDAWIYVRDTPSPLHTKALAVLKDYNRTEYEAIMNWQT